MALSLCTEQNRPVAAWLLSAGRGDVAIRLKEAIFLHKLARPGKIQTVEAANPNWASVGVQGRPAANVKNLALFERPA